jgi:hypothetical protein
VFEGWSGVQCCRACTTGAAQAKRQSTGSEMGMTAVQPLITCGRGVVCGEGEGRWSSSADGDGPRREAKGSGHIKWGCELLLWRLRCHTGAGSDFGVVLVLSVSAWWFYETRGHGDDGTSCLLAPPAPVVICDLWCNVIATRVSPVELTECLASTYWIVWSS